MILAAREEKQKGGILFALCSQTFFLRRKFSLSFNLLLREGTLNLTKFQGIYLSKAFLNFEADVKEKKYIELRREKIPAYRPEDE